MNEQSKPESLWDKQARKHANHKRRLRRNAKAARDAADIAAGIDPRLAARDRNRSRIKAIAGEARE